MATIIESTKEHPLFNSAQELVTRLQSLSYGEKLKVGRECASSCYDNIVYQRVGENEAVQLLTRKHENPRGPFTCNRCNHQSFLLQEPYRDSSDGYCGVQFGTFLCGDVKCGLRKEHDAETYDDIFKTEYPVVFGPKYR